MIRFIIVSILFGAAAVSLAAPAHADSLDTWVQSVCKPGTYGPYTERGVTRAVCMSRVLPKRPIMVSAYPPDIPGNLGRCSAYATLESEEFWLFVDLGGGRDGGQALAPLKPFGFNIEMTPCDQTRTSGASEAPASAPQAADVPNMQTGVVKGQACGDSDKFIFGRDTLGGLMVCHWVQAQNAGAFLWDGPLSGRLMGVQKIGAPCPQSAGSLYAQSPEGYPLVCGSQGWFRN